MSTYTCKIASSVYAACSPELGEVSYGQWRDSELFSDNIIHIGDHLAGHAKV